jgi:hypothetical protein
MNAGSVLYHRSSAAVSGGTEGKKRGSEDKKPIEVGWGGE